jgi:hypothetical protein
MTTLSPTKMTTTTPATLTAFRVRVVWDTQEEVPEFVCFPADVAEKISAEINDLVGDDEDEREEWTDHCIVKHLEATTGWLVSSWKMAEDEEECDGCGNTTNKWWKEDGVVLCRDCNTSCDGCFDCNICDETETEEDEVILCEECGNEWGTAEEAEECCYSDEEDDHVDAKDYLAYLEEAKADAVGEDVAKIEKKIEAWKKIAVWDA